MNIFINKNSKPVTRRDTLVALLRDYPAKPRDSHPWALVPHRANSISAFRGFTLVELLVVIIIISASAAVLVPTLGSMLRAGSIEAGINTVSVSINTARMVSRREKQADMNSAGPVYADYSGSAAIFTPGGEMRIVINDQFAESLIAPTSPITTSDTAAPYYIENFADASSSLHRFNGYKDVATIDDIKLPNATGVAGICAKTMLYIAPPFAIRINEYGQIATDQDYIYYDGKDFDGKCDLASDRASIANYNPDNYDPRVTAMTLNPTHFHYALPFEKIETVAAVVLYDTGKFRSAGLVWGTSPASDIDSWMNGPPPGAGQVVLSNGEVVTSANARILYFNPYTGLAAAGLQQQVQ